MVREIVREIVHVTRELDGLLAFPWNTCRPLELHLQVFWYKLQLVQLVLNSVSVCYVDDDESNTPKENFDSALRDSPK